MNKLIVTVKFIALSVGMGTVGALFVQHTAQAIDPAAVLPNAATAIPAEENNCYRGLFNENHTADDSRTQVNKSEPYALNFWMSKYRSSTTTSVSVPYGTTSVHLQLNQLEFLCAQIVKNSDTAAGGAGSPSVTSIPYQQAKVTSSNFRNPDRHNRAPVPDSGNINAASLFYISTMMGSGTVSGISGATVTMDNPGDTLDINRNASSNSPSRYWFPLDAANNVHALAATLHTQPLTSTVTLHISFHAYAISTYHGDPGGSGDSYCSYSPSSTPIPVAYNNYGACPYDPAPFTITLVVGSAPPPAVTATCVTTGLPATMVVNKAQSFKLGFTVTSPPPSPTTNPAMNITIAPPAGSGLLATHYNNVSYTYDAATREISDTEMFTPGAPGQYNVSYSLSGYVSKTCPGQFDGVYEPYFQVVGGDIAAGAGFNSGATNCTPDSTADISSWNYDSQPAGQYYGAGSQMAALALRNIKSFISGINPLANQTPLASRTGAGVYTQGSPHGLSFANTGSGVPVNDAAGQYGGAFGVLPCMNDFGSTISGAGGSINYNASGVYTEPGGFSVGGNLGVVGGHGVVIKIKVNGDAYITNDITYDTSAGAGNYPRLDLVATGNIYVAPNVHTIHGFLVAQGTPTSGGLFATCAVGSTEVTAYSSGCNSQLDIYGAVYAKTLHLDRSYGSIAGIAGGGGLGPAEQFHYTPELWLSTPECVANPSDPSCSGSGSGAPTWDAVSSQPPTL